MIYRKVLSKLMKLCVYVLICFLIFAKANIAAASSINVLILYNENEANKGYFDNLYALENQILGMGCNITAVDSEKFQEEILKKYDLLIVAGIDEKVETYKIIKESDINICWIGKDFEKFLKYAPQNKTKEQKSNYYIDYGRFIYVPTYNILDTSYFNLESIISEILNVPSDNSYGAYLTLYDISAFRNYQNMKAAADILSSNSIPFIMAVKPIYVNGDSKEAKKYMDIVRYMQLKGGTAVLSYFDEGRGFEGEAGVVHDNEIDQNQKIVYGKLKNSMGVYIDNGIYPVAIEVPKAYFDRSDYNSILDCFSTHIDNYWGNSVKIPREKLYIKAPEVYIPNAMPQRYLHDFNELRDSVKMLKGAPNFKSIISTEQILDNSYLTDLIKCLYDMKIKIADIRVGNNRVKIDNAEITCTKGKFSLNGQAIDIPREYVAYSKESLDVGDGDIQKPKDINAKLSAINLLVVFIGAIFIVVFGVIFIYAKKIDRKKHIR